MKKTPCIYKDKQFNSLKECYKYILGYYLDRYSYIQTNKLVSNHYTKKDGIYNFNDDECEIIDNYLILGVRSFNRKDYFNKSIKIKYKDIVYTSLNTFTYRYRIDRKTIWFKNWFLKLRKTKKYYIVGLKAGIELEKHKELRKNRRLDCCLCKYNNITFKSQREFCKFLNKNKDYLNNLKSRYNIPKGDFDISKYFDILYKLTPDKMKLLKEMDEKEEIKKDNKYETLIKEYGIDTAYRYIKGING